MKQHPLVAYMQTAQRDTRKMQAVTALIAPSPGRPVICVRCKGDGYLSTHHEDVIIRESVCRLCNGEGEVPVHVARTYLDET